MPRRRRIKLGYLLEYLEYLELLRYNSTIEFMPRKKASSADNQQERSEITNWICGFVDGEGCFSISLIRNQTTSSGWQVFPEFVVTQGEKSRSALEDIKNFFGCGRIYLNRRHDNHREALLRYCVRSQKDLCEKIIPFFQQHPLRTAKKEDFKKFVSILSSMRTGKHKKFLGLQRIAIIIQSMNRKVPSRFLKSSETTRHNPNTSDKI